MFQNTEILEKKKKKHQETKHFIGLLCAEFMGRRSFITSCNGSLPTKCDITAHLGSQLTLFLKSQQGFLLMSLTGSYFILLALTPVLCTVGFFLQNILWQKWEPVGSNSSSGTGGQVTRFSFPNNLLFLLFWSSGSIYNYCQLEWAKYSSVLWNRWLQICSALQRYMQKKISMPGLLCFACWSFTLLSSICSSFAVSIGRYPVSRCNNRRIMHGSFFGESSSGL